VIQSGKKRILEVARHMQGVNHFYQLFEKSPASKVKLVFLYRFISLFLTSAFYLIGPQSPIFFKIVVCVSLFITAWILTDLQRKYLENESILKIIVLTETLGMTLLLIPTGGISSPFIWYALNPVLVAASFLTSLFCWTALTFYLGSATLIAYHIFKMGDMLIILQDKSYFYLVCLLTTVMARLFSGLTKELDSKANLLKLQQEELIQVNEKLTETNKKYEETMEHVMSLYHLMENFASDKTPKKVTEVITAHLIKLTQSNGAFFWLTDLNHEHNFIAATANKLEIESQLMNEWTSFKGNREPFVREVNNTLFWVKVISSSNYVGVMGIEVSNSSDTDKSFLLNRPFEFLAEFSEIMLERIHIDEITDQMLLVEEQNRIANEIHDSVSQRLFGIVCGLHSLHSRSKSIKKDEMEDEFQLLSRAANTAIKELRSAIYRLSSVKKGEQPFLVRLKKYLEEYAKLNDINVNYQITGDEAVITNKLKQALYRIVCEACGNAVRHGKCNSIDLRLNFFKDKTTLVIEDDGVGFNPRNTAGKKEKGIGLYNIQNLVDVFAGTFSISGGSGVGTVIEIEIPIINILDKQEVAG
jgi:two-component system, NarL family, sensor histidine kinase LiaS